MAIADGSLTASVIHSNQQEEDPYVNGIAYFDEVKSYRTIGTSFQFGGLDDVSDSWFHRADLMAVYLGILEYQARIKQTAGYKMACWDGRDDTGNKVTSGIYFYKLTTDNFTCAKKMMLIR